MAPLPINPGRMGAEDIKGVAWCAILAAAGKGMDNKLSVADRAILRGKALSWLHADLALWQRRATSADLATRRKAASEMSRWLYDRNLNAARLGAKRTDWTANEVAAWSRFWAEVRAAREEASRPVPPAKVPPSPWAVRENDRSQRPVHDARLRFALSQAADVWCNSTNDNP